MALKQSVDVVLPGPILVCSPWVHMHQARKDDGRWKMESVCRDTAVIVQVCKKICVKNSILAVLMCYSAIFSEPVQHPLYPFAINRFLGTITIITVKLAKSWTGVFTCHKWMLHEQHHGPFRHRREQLDVLVVCTLFLRSAATLYPIVWWDQHTSAIYTSLIQVQKSGSIQCWTGLNTSSHSAPRLLQNLLLGNRISHNNINNFFFSQSRRSEQLADAWQ